MSNPIRIAVVAATVVVLAATMFATPASAEDCVTLPARIASHNAQKANATTPEEVAAYNEEAGTLNAERSQCIAEGKLIGP